MAVARAFFTPLADYSRGAMADLPDADLHAAHRTFCAVVEAMRRFRSDCAHRRAVRPEPGERQVRCNTASSRSSPCNADRSTSSSMLPASRSLINVSRSAFNISSRSRRNAAEGVFGRSPPRCAQPRPGGVAPTIVPVRAASRRPARATSEALVIGQQLVEPVGGGAGGLVLGGRRGQRIGCASAPCTPDNRITHGSVSPCSNSVPITTMNVRNTTCAAARERCARQRRQRHGERRGQ